MSPQCTNFERPGIRGWLHEPAGTPAQAMILTHGASTNCEAPLLVAVAEAFVAAGYLVLRYDLPSRQKGGGMGMAAQARDREGILHTAAVVRELARVPLTAAGHSYGGRQSTMQAAEQPDLADFLMLLSYPLHPPGRPEKARTEHFPRIQTPSLFMQGVRDDFATIEEMQAALKLIPARTKLVPVEKAGHSLPPSIAGRLPELLASVL